MSIMSTVSCCNFINLLNIFSDGSKKCINLLINGLIVSKTTDSISSIDAIFKSVIV